MPRIDEEDETLSEPPADFADLLYLPETTFSSSQDTLAETAAVDSTQAEYEETIARYGGNFD
jgi:hypothetical protein